MQLQATSTSQYLTLSHLYHKKRYQIKLTLAHLNGNKNVHTTFGIRILLFPTQINFLIKKSRALSHRKTDKT